MKIKKTLRQSTTKSIFAKFVRAGNILAKNVNDIYVLNIIMLALFLCK